jgi:hypothetical protein
VVQSNEQKPVCLPKGEAWFQILPLKIHQGELKQVDEVVQSKKARSGEAEASLVRDPSDAKAGNVVDDNNVQHVTMDEETLSDAEHDHHGSPDESVPSTQSLE